MQKRTLPDGTVEVWDNGLLDWRPMRLADGQYPEWPIQPTKLLFLCPECKSHVQKITYFTAWEIEDVDPDDGMEAGVVEGEQIDINEIVYRCAAASCGWEAGQEWWDKIDDGEIEETKDQIKVVAFDIETPVKPPVQLDLWPPKETFSDWFRLGGSDQS